MNAFKTFILGVALAGPLCAQQGPGWRTVQPPTAEALAAWSAGTGDGDDADSLAPRPTPLDEREAAESLANAEPEPEREVMARIPTPPVTSGGNEADFITPEITELAHGLRYDPVKIFEYVHNFIRFEAYYGSKKGAHTTLMEGSGNEFDQCSLLVALLRASGKSPSYKFGTCTFSYDELVDWLGISATPYSYLAAGVTPSTPAEKRKYAVYNFFTMRGYPYVESSADGNSFTIPHVWVDLNGTRLSPALKYQEVTSGINLATAIGYSRSTFLGTSGVGGTTGGPLHPTETFRTQWVSGMSYSNVSSLLSTYTNNFITNVRANYDSLSGEDITGRSRILMESYDSFDDVKPITPKTSTWLTAATWTAIPTTMMSKIVLQPGLWNYSTESWTGTPYESPLTITMPDLRGRKLSLMFSGSTARFYLDETQLIAVSFTIPSGVTEFDVKVDYTHPHYELEKQANGSFITKNQTKSNQTEVRRCAVNTANAYVFIYSFGNCEKTSLARQDVLDELLRGGATDADWRVKTEVLNLIGLNYMQQVWRLGEAVSGMYDTDRVFLHHVGRMEFEGRTTLDMYGQFSSNNNRDSNFAKADKGEYLTALFGSGIEHGIIEQSKPAGAIATSTVKTFYTANQQSKKLYRGDSSNWSTVSASLTGYAGTSLSSATDAVNGGGIVLLPESGAITLNGYTGWGYALRNSTTGWWQNLIDSNSGGSDTSTGAIPSDQLDARLRSSSSRLINRSSNLSPAYNNLTQGKRKFSDPVDVVSGAWVSEVTDLQTGGGSEPLGLTFTRYYHSNRRHSNDAAMGPAWTHNYDIRIGRRTNTNASLGSVSSYQAAPFFAALAVASNLLDNEQSAKEWGAAALAINWAIDQMTNRAVGVTRGNADAEFIQMPDGAFISPPGMDLTLTAGTGNTFAMTRRHGNTINFNSDGKASSIVDPHGNNLDLTYNGSGRLTSVTDEYGRKLTFTPTTGRVTTVTETTGDPSTPTRTIGLQYYTNGNLRYVTDPEGMQTEYTYDSSRRVVSITDPMGRIMVENTYDSKDRVKYQRSRGLTDHEYEYFYTGYSNSEMDPQGGLKSHFYDARGREIGFRDALGNSDIKRFDGQDRQVQTVTPKGEIWKSVFDANHCLKETEDPSGEKEYFTYDSQLRLLTSADKRGKTTGYTYYAHHKIQTITDPLGHVTTFTYNGNGNLATENDAENVTTTYGYDTRGHVNLITVDGESRGFVNNGRGDVLSETDQESRTTTRTYNLRRQLLTTTLPAVPGEPVATTVNAYNNAGQLSSVTDAKGNVTTFTSDALGNPLTTTLPALPAGSNVITNAYDLRDWPTTVTDSLGRTLTTEYDDAGRATALEDALARRSETTYDANGQATGAKDGLNRVTGFEWNERGEKTRTTNPLLDHVDDGFDENGNKTSMTNRNGKVYTTVFDNASRPVSTTTPTAKTTSMTYYDNNQVETIHEPSGQTTTMVYNARSLLQSKSDPAGTISYAYDDSGLLKTVTEGTSVMTRSYDERGRLKSYKLTEGGVDQFTLQYRYDANGNLTKLIYPDGKEVTYTYNARNLLATVTDWRSQITTYTYDRLGRLTGINHANGAVTTIARDNADQVLSIRESANGKLFSYLAFGHDAAGQISSRLRAPLVNADWRQPSFDSTVDDDNRLLTVNSAGVIHDADGNMTSGPITSASGSVALGYNSRNQLASAGGTTYTYDSEGHRRTSTTSGNTTSYVIDPNANMSRLLVKVGPGGEKTFYVYGLGLLYEVDEAGSAKTYHFDQVGSTIARTNDSGAVIGTASYSAYGLVAHKTGDMDTPFLFNGQWGVATDANGLLNMRARYYSPYLMRFLNADPIGFSGGLNWFVYADGNPISNTDPFGLWTWTQTWGVVKAIGGAMEAAVGTTLSSTGLGAVVGVPVILHGADTFQAGMRQAMSGEEVDTYTSQGLQGLGMSPQAANLVDAGIGLVAGGAGLISGASKTATIVRAAEGTGMTVRQALRAWDVGSQALNNADYLALGGQLTNPLQKAKMIEEGFELTTTFGERTLKSMQLWNTGLTAEGDLFAGFLSALSGGARMLK